MKKHRSNGCLIAVLAFLLLIGILFAGITYRTSYAKTEIVTSTSHDGRYTLIVYMIGEPEWPFGSTHCRFDLQDGSDSIIKYPFSIQDDGATAHSDNFSIVWYIDHVTITVSGSEQNDREYILNFDGTVE